jgi:hypothetical protein
VELGAVSIPWLNHPGLCNNLDSLSGRKFVCCLGREVYGNGNSFIDFMFGGSSRGVDFLQNHYRKRWL